MTKKNLKKILFLLLTSYFLLLTSFSVRADELEEVEKKLADLKNQLEMSKAATRPLEGTLSRLEVNLRDIETRVTRIEAEIEKKEKEVAEGETVLGDFEEILGKRVRSYYIKTTNFLGPGGSISTLLGRQSFAQTARVAVYHQATINQDKKTITEIVLYVKELEKKRENLKNEKERLAKVKIEIDKQAAFLKKEVEGAKAYQAQISGEIAKLTARQQALLAEKYGGFTTSVGNVPVADDPAGQPTFDPGFRPAFAAFSFGAPHRVGMSQYGAFGRAKAGQSAEQIVKAYFAGVEIKKDYPIPQNINVDGYGSIPFEDLYLKGIAEMPSSWGDEGGMEALKAQAIVARSYALAATNNGQGSICPSEACQVFIGKNKGGKWEEAVNQTKGWVAVRDGQPIKAWYASTSGGFTISSKDAWGKETSFTQGIVDTACGQSSCWPNEAYEGLKYAKSPWFYKGWYRRYRAPSSSRSHPWLTQEEFSDILNCLSLLKADGGLLPHLSQTDKANPDTWSADKVREELGKRGLSPIREIKSVQTPQYSNSGSTISIAFETDLGTKRFDGSDFKIIFNIRAPGEIHLASSLFNIEKK